MKRHLNFTGRERIRREDVHVAIRPADGDEHATFDLEPSLARYGFPRESIVRVEASRSNVSQRWEWGTIGDLRPPTLAERQLTRVPISAMFKLLVVVADGSGRLLGLADHIKPALPSKSLIPVVLKELGGEVWRVDFGEHGDEPEMQVNSAIDGIEERVRSSLEFRALVLPQVLRSVLTQILLVKRAPLDDDNLDPWWRAWMRLAREIRSDDKTLRDFPADSDDEEVRREREEWISEVVTIFARDRVRAAGAYRQLVVGV